MSQFILQHNTPTYTVRYHIQSLVRLNIFQTIPQKNSLPKADY